MRRIFGLLTVGLLAMIAAAACVPIAEPGQTIAVSTTTPEPVAIATPAALGENVAIQGYGSASTRDERGYQAVDTEDAHLALDGDPKSYWSSDQHAPQWFSVVLDDLYLVDRIEIVAAQAPAGPTTHELWLESGSGMRTLYKRVTDVHTEDGQTISVDIEPPRIISGVSINTLHSPSWVAWREVRVFGMPSVNPMDARRGASIETQQNYHWAGVACAGYARWRWQRASLRR